MVMGALGDPIVFRNDAGPVVGTAADLAVWGFGSAEVLGALANSAMTRKIPIQM
jgi:hypothetical protein